MSGKESSARRYLASNGRAPSLARKWKILVGAFVIGIMLFLVMPSFLISRARNPVLLTKRDMRSTATGLESYYIDHAIYPPMTALDAFIDSPVERARVKQLGLQAVYPGDAKLAGLTTPVSYLTSLFTDPFTPQGGWPFAYYRNESGWLLYSPGPDWDYDIRQPEVVYDPHQQVPSAALIALTYDPSNGTRSSGDIWRNKQ